jgi:hypothetical protein
MYGKTKDVKEEDAYRFMNVVNFSFIVAAVGGGFFVGLLIGYAVKTTPLLIQWIIFTEKYVKTKQPCIKVAVLYC